MQSLDLDQTTVAWAAWAQTVFVPHSEQEYNRVVALLDGLIDLVGENEAHPLASMMDVIGVLIESYESKFVPELEDAA